jgi:hypothetical protein
MMVQEAPYPQILASLVERLTYKPRWDFELEDIDRGQGSKGLTLRVLISEPDTYDPSSIISVVHYMPVPPAAYNERSWCRWLLDQIILIERHETCEFFRVDGERPYAPNHAPGNDPYIIFDAGTIEDRDTDYRGRHFDPKERQR